MLTQGDLWIPPEEMCPFIVVELCLWEEKKLWEFLSHHLADIILMHTCIFSIFKLMTIVYTITKTN